MNLPPRPLAPVVAAFGTVALALLTWAVTDLSTNGLPGHQVSLAVLVVGGIASELVKVPTVLEEDGFFVTFAVAFLFALLLTGGPAITLVAAATTVLAGEAAGRRNWWKGAFNASQSVVSFGCAAVIVAVTTGLPRTGGVAPFTRLTDVLGVALAVIVLVAVNTMFVSVVVALQDGRTLRAVLELNTVDTFAEAVPLTVCIAPIIAVIADRPLLLPLLVVPVLLAYRAARSATRRRLDLLADALTGLPNRVALRERVAGLRSLAEPPNLALLALDLDGFGAINDALGTAVGDAVVVEIGHRLTGIFDGIGTVVALGGDRFAVLLTGVAAEEVDDAARTAQATVSQPVDHEWLSLAITARVGAVLADDTDSTDDLVQKALSAARRAKRLRIPVVTHDRADEAAARERLALSASLPHAIESGQLVLHYQPQLRLTDHEVVGVEALVRWQHPERGLLGPAAFVPLAEQSDAIDELTRFVLGRALSDQARWRAEGIELAMSVNISARALDDDALVRDVAACIDHTGADPLRLTLELTESSIVADLERGRDVLGALRRLGVEIAVDDFGTGQASLAYLDRLPVDELKIDRSFVARMTDEPRVAAIVGSTVDLAQRLGLRTVAEGVERPEETVRLAALGCEQAQGYWYTEPLPAAELGAWVAARRAPRRGIIGSVA